MTQMCVDATAEFAKFNGRSIPAEDKGPGLALLRTRLAVEELAETVVALHERDLVEVADGLADLLYVVAGAAAAYGAELDDYYCLSEPVGPPHSGDATARERMARKLCLAFEGLPSAFYHNMGVGAACERMAAAVRDVAKACNLPLRELFLEVHRSNMGKTAKVDPASKGGLKGYGYKPPDIAGVLEAARLRFAAPGTASQRP